MKLRAGPVEDGRGLPWLIEPDAGAIRPPIVDAVPRLRADLGDALLEHGALLFRGFAIDGPGDFQAFAGALGSVRDYVGGNSPRSEVIDHVYSSTEYPRSLEIALHNEMAYLGRWPSRVAFYCMTPALEGGETPLADCREILESLGSRLRDRLEREKVVYIRNLHGGNGTGLSWQASFRTEDRATVEARCRDDGVAWEWLEKGGLRTTSMREALSAHPKTAERVFFNQIVLWHHSSLAPQLREFYAGRGMGPDDFPHNCCWGDGTPIADEDVAELRACVARSTVSFPWRRGDTLLVDNVLVAHGRRSFRGVRKILVSLFA
jgi:alpha-ketoglutarate-dependent taurine dioxygenase